MYTYGYFLLYLVTLLIQLLSFPIKAALLDWYNTVEPESHDQFKYEEALQDR